MKTRSLVHALLALVSFSCGTGGDFKPVVIDLSAAKTPAPAATPTPLPGATLAPVLSTPAPPAPSTSPARAPISDSSAAGAPQDVARSRVEAYNRRDLEALASLYAPDARVYDPPDQLRDSGIAQIRRSYAQRLASAGRARLTVEQRMTQGNYVVEREIETGEPGLSASALVVSEIRHGRIVRVWVLR